MGAEVLLVALLASATTVAVGFYVRSLARVRRAAAAWGAADRTSETPRGDEASRDAVVQAVRVAPGEAPGVAV